MLQLDISMCFFSLDFIKQNFVVTSNFCNIKKMKYFNISVLTEQQAQLLSLGGSKNKSSAAIVKYSQVAVIIRFLFTTFKEASLPDHAGVTLSITLLPPET